MSHAGTDITGKVIIVTGGAAGLGRAVVERIRLAGGRPVVLDIQPVDDGPSDQVDVADGRAAEAAVHMAAAREGQLDAVVVAAGTDACGPLGEVPPDDWERVVRVNLLGLAAVARAALPHLTGRDGRIVTVASTRGLRACPEETALCASTFGVIGFSRALAAELDGDVGVTTVIPGGMDTGFFHAQAGRFRSEGDPLLADPDDVADAILYALSRPSGLHVREMVLCASTDPSWP